MRILGAISFSLFLVAGLSAQNGQRVTRAPAPVTRVPTPVTVTRVPPKVNTPGGGGIVHPVAPSQNFARGTGVGPAVILYPVYVNGYYDPSYAASQGAPVDQQQVQPDINASYAPQDPTPVPVIINNYYPGASTDNPNNGQPAPQPVTVQSSDDSTPAAPEPSEYYLIAYKDHTIYAAVAYWVDGDTLHYFVAGNKQSQVPLSQVDRDLTTRLNQEGGMEVKLPGPVK